MHFFEISVYLILLSKKNSTNLSFIETKMVSNKEDFSGKLFKIFVFMYINLILIFKYLQFKHLIR